MTFILGTASARRREIFTFFDVPFEQISSSFDERTVKYKGDPFAYAREISEGKAQALAPLYPGRPLLTADTVVYWDGKIFNKPRDLDEAKDFLHQLSGNWQSVITAVTTHKGGEFFTEVEQTRILMHPLTETQIDRYHTQFAFLDSSGGYMIEKSGSLIIEKIDGCYYNILGLPINALRKCLSAVGIDLWDHLRPYT